jgi:hypothetical protein
MTNKITTEITSKIMALQDENGCWNVSPPQAIKNPALKYYEPIYNSTLWTLILLADIRTENAPPRFLKPLTAISDHFYDPQHNIFTIGKSHFPIPCLNGNMIYLHAYFNADPAHRIQPVVEFFSKYQRFDDGDFRTPSAFPYYANRSCYGKHTCYWGIIKLLKGLSFIPIEKRTPAANSLIQQCIDFVLLHEVCFRSHDKSQFLHTNIKHLTFPNMYQADYLEILWLLKREWVKLPSMRRALHLLENKMETDGTWKIERQIRNLILPVGKSKYGNELITRRAREVLDYYRY